MSQCSGKSVNLWEAVEVVVVEECLAVMIVDVKMIKQMFQWLWGLFAVVVGNEIRNIKEKSEHKNN